MRTKPWVPPGYTENPIPERWDKGPPPGWSRTWDKATLEREFEKGILVNNWAIEDGRFTEEGHLASEENWRRTAVGIMSEHHVGEAIGALHPEPERRIDRPDLITPAGNPIEVKMREFWPDADLMVPKKQERKDDDYTPFVLVIPRPHPKIQFNDELLPAHYVAVGWMWGKIARKYEPKTYRDDFPPRHAIHPRDVRPMWQLAKPIAQGRY